jgi:hypothetical protein
MTLKEHLETLEPNARVEIWGKNNLPFSSWTAGLYLECNLKSERKMLKSKVIYDGLDENKEHVVVINMKVSLFK